MKIIKGWIAALLFCISGGAWAQSISYDFATGILTIPSVKVGTATFVNVTLLNIGNFTFTLQGATAQVPPGPALATYDPATGIATLPSVQAGPDRYDVTLQYLGNVSFRLLSATLLSPQSCATATCRLTLALTNAGSGFGGAVTLVPAQFACSTAGGQCAWDFAANTLVTLTVTPYSGSKVGAWTGCDNNPQKTSVCQVTMNTDRNVSLRLD